MHKPQILSDGADLGLITSLPSYSALALVIDHIVACNRP
jgi:hypothetical protein